MNKYRSCLLAAVGFAAISSGARAQEAPAAEPQTTSNSGGAEIVVTAQKRAQNVQDVAASVTVIGGDDLLTRGVTDVRGISQLAPAIALNQEGASTQVFIRGIGQTVDAETNDPAVSTNIDGVYASRFTLSGALFDIDRVEVLYGPQGTLYGRNAAGGTVNVTTKLPQFEFGGEGTLSYGNYNSLHGFAAVNLPVSDTLAFRVAIDAAKRDGYMSNGGNDLDRIAGRVTMRFEPTDNFSLVARAEVQHSGGMGDTLTLRPYLDPKRPWFQPIAPGDEYYSRRNSQRYSAEFNYDLNDNVTLTYIPAYTRYNFTFNSPTGYPVRYYPNPGVGGSALTGFSASFFWTNRASVWTHELRLSGETDRLKWLVGGYLYDHDVPFYRSSFNIHNAAVYSGGSAQPFSFMSGGPGSFTQVNTTSRALFGEATFSLSDAFRVTGGLRYSADKRRTNGQNITAFPASNSAAPPQVFDLSTKDDRVDWKIGVEYDIGADAMFYANAQTGYIAAGFNPSVAGTPAETFDKETVMSYTAGLKTMLLDRRLRLNFEGFYYDYSGLQVSAFDIASGKGVLKNIDKSEIYGLQVDAGLNLDGGLTINANLAYLNAKIKKGMLPPPAVFTCGAGSTVPVEYCSVNNLIDYSGLSLPKSPKWSGSISVTKDWQLANGGEISANVAGKFQSLSWGLFSHLEGLEQPGYFKGDASLTYSAPGDNWSVTAWVTNFTNKDTFVTPAAAGAYGLNTWFMDPPRMYGLRVGFKF